MKTNINAENIILSMDNKPIWVEIPELNIIVENQIHDKGKSFKEIKIPKNCRLLTNAEIIFLHNNKKYRDLLNLVDCWFFIEQPFELNKQKGVVARFIANSDGAFINCGRNPGSRSASLGVRFVRDIKD